MQYISALQEFSGKEISNFLEKKDFEFTARSTAELRGWQPGDAKYKETEDTLIKIWDSLQKHAKKDNNGKVFLSDWIATWEDFKKNPTSPLEWQSLYCKYNFQLLDYGGDGVIDADEFTSVQVSFYIEERDAVAAFKKTAKGKPTISWEEFRELWEEYFNSDDPDAPGNAIFVTDSSAPGEQGYNVDIATLNYDEK
ncbi:calexcitin-2-like [Epargyreus clarus]|uniref:calexcitin-2-like n=1 Tax=Epargyreus clarus TaxID=520877 RepID=UPI003C2B75E3